MPDRQRHGQGIVFASIAVVLLTVAGWTASETDLLRTHPAQAATPPVLVGTAPVVRTDVQQQTTVTGVLGYAGSYTVYAKAGSGGTITWLPPVGAQASRGQPAYQVNGQPVPLLYGTRPAWRDIGPGTSGPDVRELQENLASLGYGPGLTATGQFSLATGHAVARWQRAEGLPVTGSVPLGQVVFLPGPLLVTQQAAAVGGPVPSGTPILQGTGTTPVVQVQLNPSLVPGLRDGDTVTVTMPDGMPAPGTVAQVSKIAVNQGQGSASQQGGSQSQQSGGQQALIPVMIKMTGTVGGFLDQAQVQVSITSAEARNVLAVPVTALLARPGGTFAVTVTTGPASRTVPVQAGLFDQITGLVEVSGPGLADGERVVVPAT